MLLKKFKTEFLVAIARLIAKLPTPVILKIGGGLGYLTWIIPNKRKKVANRNISLCFPSSIT